MTQEYTYSGRIFGTTYSLAILHASADYATTLAMEAVATMQRYEYLCSRFRADSELTELNQKKSLVVSPEFFALVRSAREMYDRTAGIFNPLVQVSELGYQKSRSESGTITPDSTVPSLNYDTNFATIELNIKTKRITLCPEQKIDLGGILKGYLADHIATRIYEQGHVDGVIVNIGGDLATRGHDLDSQPFTCTIFNPLTDLDTDPLQLSNQSLATSGTYNRTWQRDGTPTHHIVDPTSHQNPKQPLISASIIHKDGAAAEAFAKVFLIAGTEQAREILKNETYSYYLIASDGTITTNLKHL